MTRWLASGTIAAVSILTACASLEGRRVVGPPTEVEGASGVPYYLAQPSFKVQRKTTKAGKPASPVYELVVGSRPDPNRRFEVGFAQGWFSTDTFEVKLATDARVTALTATSEDRTAQVIAGLVALAAEAARFAAAFSDVDINAMFLFVDKHDLLTDEEILIAKCFLKIRQQGCPALTDDQLRAKYTEVSAKLRKVFVECSADSLEQDCHKLEGLRTRVRTLQEIDPYGDPTLPSREVTEAMLKKFDDVSGCAPEDEPLDRAECQVLELTDFLDVLETREREVMAKTAASAPPTPDKIIGKLKKDVEVALSRALADPANRPALQTAINAYKAAVELVIAADEAATERALPERRKVLVDFVRRAPPSNANMSQSRAYAQYAEELEKVQAAIQAMLGSADKPPDGGEATEVTSEVNRDVFVYRWDVPLAGKDLVNRMSLGRARVTYGNASAVVIAAPLGEER